MAEQCPHCGRDDSPELVRELRAIVDELKEILSVQRQHHGLGRGGLKR